MKKIPEKFSRIVVLYLVIVSSLFSALVGAYVALRLWGHNYAAFYLFANWGESGSKLFLIVFLLINIVWVARWPRKTPIDYNKITPSGVVAANFITLIMGAMLIITTLALVAPGVLELLAKYLGD